MIMRTPTRILSLFLAASTVAAPTPYCESRPHS